MKLPSALLTAIGSFRGYVRALDSRSACRASSGALSGPGSAVRTRGACGTRGACDPRRGRETRG